MILDKSDQVILIKIIGVVAVFLILALEFVPKGLSRYAVGSSKGQQNPEIEPKASYRARRTLSP